MKMGTADVVFKHVHEIIMQSTMEPGIHGVNSIPKSHLRFFPGGL